MEKRALKCRENISRRPFICNFYFTQEIEKSIWENISINILDPNIKAFAFKLAHNCLPTKYEIWRRMRHFGGNDRTPFCQFCKMVSLVEVDCTADHIFRYCPVAKNVWRKVNSNLRFKGFQTYDVNQNLVHFRLNLNKNESYLISEILWALWRVNNYNNYQISEEQTHLIWTQTNVMRIAKNRISKTSMLDRLIHGNRAYNKRWEKINELLGFVFDTG